MRPQQRVSENAITGCIPCEYLLVSPAMPTRADKKTSQDLSDKRLRLLRAFELSLKISNWNDWARMPTWTPDEAAALTLGVSPPAVLQYLRRNHPIIQRFKIVRESVRRACAAGEIASGEYGIAPADYLKWAKQYEFELPEVLTAEISRLREFAAKRPKDKPLAPRERDTLLKIILGMAMGGYGYDPAASKSSTVKEIHDDLALRGIVLDPDTIRNKLRDAVNLIADELHPAD